MLGADLLKPLADDAVSQFGAVAVAAEVAQVQVPQLRRDDLFGRLGCGVVRKVSVAALNPLFDAPRAFQIVLEQLNVVVGFQNENVGRAHALDDQFRRMA